MRSVLRAYFLGSATLAVACSTASQEDERFRIPGAKMEPVFEAGASIGIRFSHVLSDSCIGGLGIRDGDVLVSLNDQPISSINDHVRFLNALGEILPFSMQLRGEDGETRVLRAEGCGLAPTGDAV